jgi:Domain of unknown function (DUF4124)
MKKKLLGVTFGLLLNAPAPAGDVYSWVDDQGQAHFGDQPPVGVQAGRAEVRPAGGSDAAPVHGLRSGERAWLSEIEKQESREAAERRAREKQTAAEEKQRQHQGGQDARRCASYQQKISEYNRRLRAGCRVSRCNYYDAQLADYKSRAALVCR